MTDPKFSRALLIASAMILAACQQGITPAASAADTPQQQKGKSMFRTLTDTISVSPQISLADVAAAKSQGVTLIINNRPDGEDESAPQGADIESAAKAAGIDYVAIPVTHSGFSAAQIDAMIAALGKADGKVLAYCRSGTRSTLLWSLSQARQGAKPDDLAATAAAAGYDLGPIRPLLDQLSGQASGE